MEPRATWDTFQHKLKKKKKKNPLWKNFLYFYKRNFFLYFGKWNFIAPNLKNYHIFPKKAFFLYFRRELSELKKWQKLYLKKFVMFFQKKVFLIFQEMELHGPVFFLKKFFLMFQEGTSEAQKTKNLLCFFLDFGEWYCLAPNLKIFLYFYI